jgi:signal transduction histidine kinase
MLNIGIDISDRKTAEAELERYRDHLEALVVQRTEQLVRARDAAEAAGQAKAAFVANLSHAVRTPMNAILGFTYLIRDRVRDPETRDHLEHLSASAQHLLEVINGILDLSRIDAGKMQLEPHAFSPDAMLDGVVSMLTPAARAKGLSLTIVKEALPGRLVGDEPRLTQVLNNLVDNAIKFTEHGGVTIRCDVQPAGEGQAIARFEVTDTGIGIPEALQRSLFSDSEQAGDPAGSGQAGSGLGLAITRRLVGMMGGQIGVSSRQDVGSTFWFTARLGLGEETSTTGPR